MVEISPYRPTLVLGNSMIIWYDCIKYIILPITCIIQRLNGGIVMVNFYDCFVIEDCNTRNATVQDVVGKTVKFCQVFCSFSLLWPFSLTFADHINHIREVAGVDHIGIGADFNGVTKYVWFCFFKVRSFWKGHKSLKQSPIWHFLSKRQIKLKIVSNFVAFLD